MNTQKEMQHLKKLTAILEMIEFAEIKIKNFEERKYEGGFFCITHEMNRRNEITKLAKERLETYYFNTKNQSRWNLQ